MKVQSFRLKLWTCYSSLRSPFYGLAFCHLFCHSFRDLRKSRIAIASALPILALFGFIHGFHEWSELYLVMYEHEFTLTKGIETFKVFKLWFSFIALVLLHGRCWISRLKHIKAINMVHSPCLALFVISLIVRFEARVRTYIHNTANQVRWIFGLGAGAISGLAMMSLCEHPRKEGRRITPAFANRSCLMPMALQLY